MIRPGAEDLLPESRSAGYLRATRLVSDLHQQLSHDAYALLRDLIQGAAESLPGAQYCGITLSRRRPLSENAFATHRYPVVLDEIQNRSQQGPSLSTAAVGETVRIDDLAHDDRWPTFRDEALALTPVRSILSVPMFREREMAATLSFYAERSRAFGAEASDLGLIFATHAAPVWNMARREQQFRAALASRDVIGQAKGRMMERFNIDAGGAFEMLKLMSQNSNTPIALVAQRVVAGLTWPAAE